LLDKTYLTSSYQSNFESNRLFGGIGEGRTIGLQVTTKF